MQNFHCVQFDKKTAKWQKFENAALFLQSGIPSTLISHKNGTFRKRSSNRKDFSFSFGQKTFQNGASRQR